MTFVFPGYLQRQRDLNDPQYLLSLLDKDLKTLLAEKDKANGMNDNDIDAEDKGSGLKNILQHDKNENEADKQPELEDVDFNKNNSSSNSQQKKIN